MPFWRPSALARTRLTMQNQKYITRDHINGAAAARDTDNELPPLARPPTPRGEWRQLIAHQRPTQHTDPRCTLRPPGRGALSLFGPLASPGLIWRWPALGCAPAARRGGDLGGRRSCRERAQRGRGCAARRGRALGSRGMAGRGGTPACPRSSQPHTQAEPRTAAREFGTWQGQQGPRMAKDPFCFWLHYGCFSLPIVSSESRLARAVRMPARLVR